MSGQSDLDFSKLKRGEIVLYKSPFNIRGLPSPAQKVLFERLFDKENVVIKLKIGTSVWKRRVVKSQYVFPLGAQVG